MNRKAISEPISLRPGDNIEVVNAQPKALRVTLNGQATGLRLVVTLAPGMQITGRVGTEGLVVVLDDDAQHPGPGLRPAP